MKKLLTFAAIVLMGLFSTTTTQATVNVAVLYSQNPCMTSMLDTRLVELSWFIPPNDPTISYDVYFANTFVTSTSTSGGVGFFVTATTCNTVNGTWKVIEKTSGLPTDSGTVVVKVTPPAIMQTVVVTPALSQLYFWQSATLKLTPKDGCYTYTWYYRQTTSSTWSQVPGAFNSQYSTNKAGFYNAQISDGVSNAQSMPVEVRRKWFCMWRTSSIDQTSDQEPLSTLRTTGQLTAETEMPCHVTVLDMQARVVKVTDVVNGSSLDLSWLSDGSYVIVATNKAGESSRQKIMLVK